MEKEFDSSTAKKATDVPILNKLRATKERVTIMLDKEVIEGFRALGEANGSGYQTEINRALRSVLKASTETAQLSHSIEDVFEAKMAEMQQSLISILTASREVVIIKDSSSRVRSPRGVLLHGTLAHDPRVFLNYKHWIPVAQKSSKDETCLVGNDALGS
jgi:uncharacterized protein (DUF4415 family)